MADEEEAQEAEQLSDKQKMEIAKWFLLNSPPGEIQYVAKGSSLLPSLFAIRIRLWSACISSFSFVFGAIELSAVPFGLDFADVRSVLDDDRVYNEAAAEAFPVYNKSHMICLEMPGRAGDVRSLTTLLELD